MQRRFNVGISISPTDEKRRLVVFGETPTRKKYEPWRIVVYSDSDFAIDPDTRRSTSGYILYLQDVPIAWKSKAQQSVSLSSTEA
eukprot:scaffold2308_cov130-Alexandrium_tamarense.AAC.4